MRQKFAKMRENETEKSKSAFNLLTLADRSQFKWDFTPFFQAKMGQNSQFSPL